MTLAQLLTALQARGFGTDTEAAQTEALNGRYRELMGLHRWRFNDASTTLTLSTGDTSLDLSTITDLDSVSAVRIQWPATGTPTEQYELTWLEAQDFRSRRFEGEFDTATSEGIPVWWTQFGGEDADIDILPAADRDYLVTVDYNKFVTDLSASGDEPAFPDRYHDILVWGAIVDMAARERDYAGAQFAQGMYDTRLREMERKLGIRQKQNSAQVRRSAFWGQVGRSTGGWGR